MKYVRILQREPFQITSIRPIGGMEEDLATALREVLLTYITSPFEVEIMDDEGVVDMIAAANAEHEARKAARLAAKEASKNIPDIIA